MEKDIKREALRRYLKYFKVWFIIAGILAVITIGVAVVHLLTPKTVRGNSQDPTERVFDYADMLTDEEEQSLREYIAECEEKIQADIVIVTISESVEYDLQNPGLAEAFHAKEVGSTDWSTAMRNLADNFYDYNNFGYNKVHGNAPGRGDKNFPFTQRHAVFFGVKPGNLLPKLRVPQGSVYFVWPAPASANARSMIFCGVFRSGSPMDRSMISGYLPAFSNTVHHGGLRVFPCCQRRALNLHARLHS